MTYRDDSWESVDSPLTRNVEGSEAVMSEITYSGLRFQNPSQPQKRQQHKTPRKKGPSEYTHEVIQNSFNTEQCQGNNSSKNGANGIGMNKRAYSDLRLQHPAQPQNKRKLKTSKQNTPSDFINKGMSEVVYSDLRLQHPAQPQNKRELKTSKQKAPSACINKDHSAPSSLWKIIAVILGVICLALLASVGFLVTMKLNPVNEEGHTGNFSCNKEENKRVNRSSFNEEGQPGHSLCDREARMSQVVYSDLRLQHPVQPQNKRELETSKQNAPSDCINKVKLNPVNAEGHPGNFSCNKEGNKAVNQSSVNEEGQPGHSLCDKEANKAVWKDPVCSLNWYQHGGNCYFFSRMMVPWNKCLGYCTGFNASFVKVDTNEAMDFVMHLSKLQCQMIQEKFFLSLSYKTQQQKWVWFDGTDYTLNRFAYHSMEVDFWDLRSNVPFVDGNFEHFSTVFHNSTVERVISPGTTNESQENPDCCSCQERWIGYQCSCYYISREAKSWNESRKFCASQKSTLLHMYNKDELKFMSFNKDTYWIGATYNVQFGTWQWGDGSDVSQDLYSSFKTALDVYHGLSKFLNTNFFNKSEHPLLSKILYTRSSKISVMSEVTYAKTQHQCHGHPQRRQEVERFKKKDLSNHRHKGLSTPSSSWRVLAVILGLLCLALLAAVGFLAYKLNQNSVGADGHLGNSLCNKEAYGTVLKYPICSTNWYQRGVNCYFLSKMTFLWEQCPGYCTGLNSSFVKVDTQEVMNFLMQLSKMQCDMQTAKYFLSLSYNSERQSWVWLDGTDYIPNQFYFPTVTNARNKCLHVRNGRTNAEDCKISGYCICPSAPSSSWKVLAVVLGLLCLALLAVVGFLAYKFIQNSYSEKKHSCKKEGDKKVWKNSVCPPNWYQHGGNCYFFSRMMLPWNKCPDNCASLNSSFVKVDTEEAMDFVIQLSKLQCEMRQEKFFLSLAYKNQRQKWVWLDGTDYTLNNTSCRRGLQHKGKLSPVEEEESNWHIPREQEILGIAHRVPGNVLIPKPCTHSMTQFPSSGTSKLRASPTRTRSFLSYGSFLDKFMEVDFWNPRSDMPFVDSYIGNMFNTSSNESTISLGNITKFQIDFDCCSCQEKWVGYQCNCYFISSDGKSWDESRKFCASHNSTLLHLHKRDELNFMRFSEYFYWIGIVYSTKNSTWLWEDGSLIFQDLSSHLQNANTSKCISYNPSLAILDERCKKENFYICKQQLIKKLPVEDVHSERPP
ncbi:PREDICTED: uncharacterized protein LOC101627204 [Condylura cristata]|uniref:uncharacterized protein LOC101627204 n=1 Tax=Condylura cristata TaxID=143302 RepID=UPI000642BA64|nr:PREDICTED: uncharacterized protein LOC101627204 [Condylura cristata]